MAGQSSQDVLAQTAQLFSQRVQEYADGIANRLGQPQSGSELTKEQVLQRWNYTPLGSTQLADQQFHQLLVQGMPAGQALDQVYPFRKMLFRGPDLKTQIETANKIAGWAAEASGSAPPEPRYLPPTGSDQVLPPQGPQQAPQAPPPLQGPAVPAGPAVPPVPVQGAPATPLAPPPAGAGGPPGVGGPVPPMPPNAQIVSMT